MVYHFVRYLLCILVSVFMRVLTKRLYRMIERTERDMDFLCASEFTSPPPPHILIAGQCTVRKNCYILNCHHFPFSEVDDKILHKVPCML